MSNLDTVHKPSKFFLALADLVDGNDNWEDTQFTAVERVIDKCEALASLCDLRGYTSMKITHRA